jgi:type I restriction enzyme M protein
MILSADIKGDAYEGLLERNARDTKSGAGQYFTSRPLVDGIIECLAPEPGETMIDPACGTGGTCTPCCAFPPASSTPRG